MKTITTGCSVTDRELNAILENKQETKINRIQAKDVRTKSGRKLWDFVATILILGSVWVAIAILNAHGLIREF